MGGITSSFRFESYKIDHIFFEMKKILQLLETTGNIDPKAWRFSVSIGKPIYISSHKKYISNLRAGLLLMPNVAEAEQSKAEEIEPLVTCEVNIAGLFSVEEGRFDKEVEMNIVKLQFPTLLLPYARSAMTSILADAGFGSVVLPLVNMHEIAKRIENELTLQIID